MSDAKLEHTPLPWKQVSREGKIGVDIRGANGRAVAATFGVANQPKSRAGAQAQAREDRANAELIVAAVNSYPQREAMRSALEAWRRTHTGCCRDGCRQCAEDGNTPHRCALCIKTDAALEAN
jgi:hypothetical protein